MRRTPKLLILGHMRHGKDTLAEMLRDRFELRFQSSSQAAADIFIYDDLKEKYGYKTSEECFEDRVNHRPEWHKMICDYNKDDKARLAKGILKNADCYVGMRDTDEINECMNQGLFDLIIWVDASERLPKEPTDSFNIDQSIADFVIENNGTIEEFEAKVLRIGKILTGRKPIILGEPTSGFLTFFKDLMIEDEDGELEIDIYSFTNEVYLHGWPKVDGDSLDLENWNIMSLDDYGMVLNAGGDWQMPQSVTIKFDGEKVFVESFKPVDDWNDGLNEDQIKEILGVITQD